MNFWSILQLIPLIKGLIKDFKEAMKDGLTVDEILALITGYLYPIARLLGEDLGDLPTIAPELQSKVDAATAKAEMITNLLGEPTPPLNAAQG